MFGDGVGGELEPARPQTHPALGFFKDGLQKPLVGERVVEHSRAVLKKFKDLELSPSPRTPPFFYPDKTETLHYGLVCNLNEKMRSHTAAGICQVEVK